jgi:flagellar basal body-associated protein FliL
MSLIAVVVIVIALIMSGVAAWGYQNAKDDAQKKRVYTGVGVFGLILGIGGVVIMMMGGSDQKNAQADSNLPNNPNEMRAMHNKLDSTLDRLRSKMERSAQAAENIQRALNVGRGGG